MGLVVSNCKTIVVVALIRLIFDCWRRRHIQLIEITHTMMIINMMGIRMMWLVVGVVIQATGAQQMMILLSRSGERGSIVVGVIADDVFLCVLGPTPVEVVVEDEMKLGAARLAAYDVEEEVEAEVEHLEHVEALHERDLEQTLIVDEDEYHLRDVARRDGQKQKERDEYEENSALFELTVTFGQRVIRWSTRLILLLLLIIIIKQSCVSFTFVSVVVCFACSLMMIVGLYERVQLGLLTR